MYPAKWSANLHKLGAEVNKIDLSKSDLNFC